MYIYIDVYIGRLDACELKAALAAGVACMPPGLPPYELYRQYWGLIWGWVVALGAVGAGFDAARQGNGRSVFADA